MMLQQAKNTRRNTLRHLVAPILTILVAMLLTVVAWGQSLDKGTYTITNSVSHDNPVGQGMARSYTEETSDIEVNDSGTFVALSFNNTQYMGDFTISVGGSKVTYETTALGNNIKKLKFKVPSLSSSIKVGLYVQPMDTTVEYTVTLNEGSLKLIKKAETVVETTSNSTSGNTTESSSNTAANNAESSNATSNNATSTNTNSTNTNSTNTNSTNNGMTSGTTNSNADNKTTTNTTATHNEANNTSSGTVAISDSNKTGALEKVSTSSDSVKKVDEAETAEKAQVSNSKEVAENAEPAEAAQESFAANLEEVENEEVSQVEETLEGQEQNETEETASETASETEDENTAAETSKSSSAMKNIMLIIGGIIVVGILGFVIYLKRK